MRPRIALPVPHSGDRAYSERTLPQYLHALTMSGAEPLAIDLEASPEQIAKMISECQAVLLPGSKADVDPQKFGAARDPNTAPPDPARDNVDELLIQDAYNLHKPVLGICYGLQILNVWRSGTLDQHIESGQEHTGKDARHAVHLESGSILAEIAANSAVALDISVNSSHHQAAALVGDGLRVTARCEDGTIEALEGTAPDHFVLAVQWHPERGFDEDVFSRKLFAEFVRQAEEYRPRPIVTSVSKG